MRFIQNSLFAQLHKLIMKKITDYKKLLQVSDSTTLADLRSSYKKLMKTWHPDRFIDNDLAKQEAETMSKDIIEAYHFLVSISPETLAETIELYKETTVNSAIADFEYNKQVLKVEFVDGNAYEYFDVPKNTYIKLVNADSPGRFARRHIFNNFLYRSCSRLVAN